MNPEAKIIDEVEKVETNHADTQPEPVIVTEDSTFELNRKSKRGIVKWTLVKEKVERTDDLKSGGNRHERRKDIAWQKGARMRARKWEISKNLKETKAEGRKIQNAKHGW